MGRPYQSELAQIPTTIDWALKQDISGLRHTLLYELGPYNLVAVGSGGSLVAAEFAALLHETVTGHLARSATPLEATFRQTPQNTAALLLSASGSNADILQAGRLLPQLGYETTAALCTRRESRLSAIVSDLGGIVHEFPIPSGHDGFLATNSLIATLILLHRAASALPIPNEMDGELTLSDVTLKGTETALDNRTLIVLGQGWAAQQRWILKPGSRKLRWPTSPSPTLGILPMADTTGCQCTEKTQALSRWKLRAAKLKQQER